MSARRAPRDTAGASTNGARDEPATLAELRRDGATVRAVVFTTNRRVMASLADRGKTLRLHQCFASAPPPVLHALARLFSARTASARTVARQVVNAYLADQRPAEPEPSSHRPRTRDVVPGDEPHLERLQAEFDRVNREHFGCLLPKVQLFLSGRMKSRNGHFSRHPLEIVISRRLCTDAEAGEAELTLRHEMIHLWQHVVRTKPDHGPAFRWWARLLGVHPRARRPVGWKTP